MLHDYRPRGSGGATYPLVDFNEGNVFTHNRHVVHVWIITGHFSYGYDPHVCSHVLLFLTGLI